MSELDTISNNALLLLQNNEGSLICYSDDNCLPLIDELNQSNQIISSTGTILGAKEYRLFIETNQWNRLTPLTKRLNGHWRGRNGKWYADVPTEGKPFYGNQYTGNKADIKAKAGKFRMMGKACFYLSTGISLYDLANSCIKGDYSGALKASVDISIGIIAAYGGPVGWAIGGIYLILNLCGTFDNTFHKSSNSYYRDPLKCDMDNTYVAPKIIPFRH